MNLREQILQDISDRSTWETRQETFYTMRHTGIRRRSKPYPGAPDMHFPLIDSVIEKLKPFYFQQIYATEQIAGFIPLEQQDPSTTTAIGAWFDYKLKHESNFEREILCAIDYMLQNGTAPLKVFWQEDKKRLEFDACDPLHVIVPKWTEELQDADRLVHVLQMSEAQYRNNPNYRKDDDFVKKIKGKGAKDDGNAAKESVAAVREGITTGQNDEQIVVWEIYTRDPQNWNRIIVKTRSPLNFEEPIRPDFEHPYEHGKFPFVKLRTEIKDKGYYSPRGNSEVLAPFETALCKMWNSELEWLDFHGRPQFRQTQAGPQPTQNYTSAPGGIVPYGLEPVTPPSVPPAFRDQMNMTRTMAEYRVAMPDYGIVDRAMGQANGKTTATQVNAVVQQSAQGTDLRGRVFRLDLLDICGMAYALLCQFAKDSLTYVQNDASQTLEQGAVHSKYKLTLNGSADAWNKNTQMQKALALFNLLRGDAYTQQGELRKMLFERDEPGMVKRLYIEPQDAAAQQGENQAYELILMERGRAVPINGQDDDAAHLDEIGGYLSQKLPRGEITPPLARLILQHGGPHIQALYAKKDPRAKEYAQKTSAAVQMLQQIAAQPDPRELAAAQNIMPMATPQEVAA